MIVQTRRIVRNWRFWLGAATLLGIGFWFGQQNTGNSVVAQQAKGTDAAPETPVNPENNPKRVVAYIYNSMPITREEFGDYLISMYCNDRIDLFVNKKIIDHNCAQKGISVTDAEINAAIEDDCKRMSINKKDFIANLLKRYNKSLDEWRFDVMKPRLMLAKYCRDQIVINEEDLRKMFTNRFGEKAQCKIIIWRTGDRQLAQRSYGQLRDSDAGFDAVATKQADANLAASAGAIQPIGHFSGSESDKVEQIVFGLKVGEVSPIIDLPVGHLVVKRTGTIEADKNVDYAKVRDELYKEVLERKVEKEIPVVFKKMLDEAKPQILIGKKRTSLEEFLQPNPTQPSQTSQATPAAPMK